MHKDFFVNFLGPDCLNPRCRHFKNGSKDGISAAELASRKPNRPFDVGDHIVFDRGASWTDGKEPDGVMLLGMIVAHHPDGIPEPFWKVRLLEDSEFPGKYIVGAGTDLGVYPRFMEWPD
jgi:hypothetical protein